MRVNRCTPDSAAEEACATSRAARLSSDADDAFLVDLAAIAHEPDMARADGLHFAARGNPSKKSSKDDKRKDRDAKDDDREHKRLPLHFD